MRPAPNTQDPKLHMLTVSAFVLHRTGLSDAVRDGFSLGVDKDLKGTYVVKTFRPENV